jgi:hypothetical protein
MVDPFFSTSRRKPLWWRGVSRCHSYCSPKKKESLLSFVFLSEVPIKLPSCGMWRGVDWCLFVFFCEGPRSRCYGPTAALRLIVQPYDEGDYFFPVFPCNGVRWNEIYRGKPKYSGGKPVPVPLFSPQIPHGLTWDWTRASAVRCRRLTAWATPRPTCVLVSTGCVTGYLVTLPL